MTRQKQISVLATDMDGTFIPLEGNDENRHDLQRLCRELERRELELVYVTGRHYELVLDAVRSHELPMPQWLICDVGTSIYVISGNGEHEVLRQYHARLSEIVGDFHVALLAEHLTEICELRIQEPEKQGPFKLSYYCEASLLDVVTNRASKLLDDLGAPYRAVASIDPFTGEGLIDWLPDRVSKDFALSWWVDHTQRNKQSVVFAGDSGNDLAALTAGYRSIVVANADKQVKQEVATTHQLAEWTDRLFISSKPATSGVLEGLKHFLDLSND